MIMVVDIANCNVVLTSWERLAHKGEELSVRVDTQREEVFHVMHRI